MLSVAGGRRGGLARWVVLVLLLAGAGPAGATGDATWKIGVMGALSGPKAPYGVAHLQGARLAVEEINARGGVAGRPLELIAVDDRGEMGEAGPLAVRLVTEEGVLALIGSVDSGVTHVLAMIAVKSHVPHLTCVATDPSLTRAGSPWTFRTLADDERQAAALVEELVIRQGRRRLALVAGSSRYGRMGARTFARLARAAGAVVDGPHLLPADPAGWFPVVDRARADDPEAIILWTLSREGKAAAGRLAALGYRGVIAGGDGLATPDFFADPGPGIDGTLVTCPYDESNPAPAHRAFQQAFQARYGRAPDSFAAHAYDTVGLVAAALARLAAAGVPPTRAALRDELAAAPPYEGVTGRLVFDATGNDRRPVQLARVRGGRLALLPDRSPDRRPAPNGRGAAAPEGPP
ncbi:MAG: Branched-chain amino acid ABC transporter, amino acid-binding protein [Candidatus Ozemobacter sibiricus]|uniref:Branched-chain amino acid ABC transporter, amino acid-binding protein n=1 Tax=Candidatus Ozemobacter sibiricus TaxID=2268124 RepID=A0A367ZPS0_9BACT|nr:MAG: Branched-chain amino acid ABC transporter, amino acid-binding protein [Candidatus Ozemobacter sibiricus]